jgi:isoquinoline 1-oxidoreductase subunit beta
MATLQINGQQHELDVPDDMPLLWDDGANAKVTTADIVQQMEIESQKSGVVARKEGDVAKGLEGSAKKLVAVYEMPFLAHAAMEPMNCTVHVREGGCDIWAAPKRLPRR